MLILVKFDVKSLGLNFNASLVIQRIQRRQRAHSIILLHACCKCKQSNTLYPLQKRLLALGLCVTATFISVGTLVACEPLTKPRNIQREEQQECRPVEAVPHSKSLDHMSQAPADGSNVRSTWLPQVSSSNPFAPRMIVLPQAGLSARRCRPTAAGRPARTTFLIRRPPAVFLSTLAAWNAGWQLFVGTPAGMPSRLFGGTVSLWKIIEAPVFYSPKRQPVNVESDRGMSVPAYSSSTCLLNDSATCTKVSTCPFACGPALQQRVQDRICSFVLENSGNLQHQPQHVCMHWASSSIVCVGFRPQTQPS